MVAGMGEASGTECRAPSSWLLVLSPWVKLNQSSHICMWPQQKLGTLALGQMSLFGDRTVLLCQECNLDRVNDIFQFF